MPKPTDLSPTEIRMRCIEAAARHGRTTRDVLFLADAFERFVNGTTLVEAVDEWDPEALDQRLYGAVFLDCNDTLKLLTRGKS